MSVADEWKTDLKDQYGRGLNRLLPFLLKAFSFVWLSLCILLAGSAIYNLFQVQSLRTETAHRRELEEQIESLILKSTALRHLDHLTQKPSLQARLHRAGYSDASDLVTQLQSQVQAINGMDKDYGLTDWTGQLDSILLKIQKTHNQNITTPILHVDDYSNSITGLIDEWFATSEGLSRFGKYLSSIQDDRSGELQRNNVLLAVAVLGFSLALVGLNLWKQARESERHALEMNSLHDEIRKDPLTGVLNRRGWVDLTARQIRHMNKFGRTAVSVAILDIDHFKQFNDTHGHDAGDRRLIEFGHMLKLNFRPCDLISRIGGEEFAILLPNCTVEDSKRIIDRIRELPDSKIKFSAGIASLEECHGLENAMLVADEAMYQAKNSGRNQCCIGHPQSLHQAA